ncbi:hypothetical protein [Paludibacterium denitrificans]|uniref:hypothetical protein n=1 Tax=Paludibacterium denitrificans TaxID=2675226 RepID=UPI001E3DD1CC|nr:hypothetical protein [Paludibacterium denitrificans]
MYQELTKNRSDWLLSEVEHTPAIASQELQLAGNVLEPRFPRWTWSTRGWPRPTGRSYWQSRKPSPPTGKAQGAALSG